MMTINFPTLFRSIRYIRLIGCLLALAALPLLHAVADDPQDIPDPEVIASPVAGTTIRVNTTTDELNLTAEVENGKCSLREAIYAANNDKKVDTCPAGNGTDEIQIPAGTYTLSKTGKDEEYGVTGDLDIRTSMRIVGQGPDLTIINANSIDRVFQVIGPGITVEFYNLVIQNGSTAYMSQYGGGGIYNDNATLTLSGCTLRNNQAAYIGGGVDNNGTLKIENSTLHDNSALNGGGGLFNGTSINLDSVTFYNNTGGQRGGAINNSSEANLVNVTISNNTADQGGGIFTDWKLTLLNVTITGNSSGIANFGNPGDTRAISTIIAKNGGSTDKNCLNVAITSVGNNLESGTTCGFNGATDWQNEDPKLADLGDNGGPTWTHMPQAGSRAIDKGNVQNCLIHIFDQRGAIRPADGDGNGEKICDIGSVEVNGMFPLQVYLPVVRR